MNDDISSFLFTFKSFFIKGDFKLIKIDHCFYKASEILTILKRNGELTKKTSHRYMLSTVLKRKQFDPVFFIRFDLFFCQSIL